MGFKIKNSLTGEFEKLPILTLKGEKGETGGVEEYNKVDYMGNKYETLKQANDANVEYAVKTAIGEFNYLDYKGQHITTTDSIEGQCKSAILTGQTLVNVDSYYTKSNFVALDGTLSDDGWITLTANGHYVNGFTRVGPLVKPNTKYLAIVEIKENTLNGYFTLFSQHSNSAIFSRQTTKIASGSVGTFKYVLTSDATFTPDTYICLRNYVGTAETSGSITYRTMLIEYQEGMENWDIPFFRGMASVKAPVLHSVGKNLCKYRDNWAHNGLTFTNTKNGVNVNGTASTYIDYYVIDDRNINLEIRNQLNSLPVGTRLVLSNNLGKNSYISYILNGEVKYADNITIQNNMEIKGAFVRFQEGDVCKNLNLTIQLEIGTKATPYEPYKSNILTTSEDLELRGIGNVKDELNLLTGEVTESIEEVVFDGSDDEKWTIQTDYVSEKYIMFGLELAANGRVTGVNPALSDKWMIGDISTEQSQSQICVFRHQGWITQLRVVIEKEKLANADVLAFRDYISKNNFKVTYAKESIVKAVALSDNHVYSYKDVTHYDCSSADGSLVPILSVKVPTDVQATIAQQRETIQTLNSENERLNQIQEALKASMLDSQVQLMNLSWDTDFEVFTLRESIAPKDFSMDSKTGSNIDKFSQAKFIIENDCPDLEKLNSQIEYYFSKDVFSQGQFEELTDLISIVKGENGCEY